jgi:phage tail protein X
MKQITPAFIKAKKEFSPALKARENSHFKNKYADLGACIDAVNEALLNNGIAMYQETFEDSTGVTVETVFLHESTETIRSGKLHVPASKQDAQGYGSALTYARRYSLMAACGIAPEDDDGNAASKAPVRSQIDMAKCLRTIANADGLDVLKDLYTAAMKIATPAQQAELTDAKDARKAQLTTKEAA